MIEPDLPVNSITFGFQWEGLWMGTFSCIIRLQGCPSSCFNCPHQTAAGAIGMACEIPGDEVPIEMMLGKNHHNSKSFAILTPSQIMGIVWENMKPPFDVIITGGEPASHDLLMLTALLVENDYEVTLHTGGELPFQVAEGTNISVRPRTRLCLPASLNAATEVIFIIRDSSDLAWLDVLMEHIDDNETSVFIQSAEPAAMGVCVDAAAERGFRISYAPGYLATHG